MRRCDVVGEKENDLVLHYSIQTRHNMTLVSGAYTTLKSADAWNQLIPSQSAMFARFGILEAEDFTQPRIYGFWIATSSLR